jgi:hypothetical protein
MKDLDMKSFYRHDVPVNKKKPNKRNNNKDDQNETKGNDQIREKV